MRDSVIVGGKLNPGRAPTIISSLENPWTIWEKAEVTTL